MAGFGVRQGQKFAVLVYVDGEGICEVISTVIAETEMATSVYTDDEATLLTARECVAASLSALDFHCEKPSLRKMIEARIAELRDMDEEGDEDYPPPPSIDDIPF